MAGTLRLEVVYDGEESHSDQRDREEFSDALHAIARKVSGGFTNGSVRDATWGLTGDGEGFEELSGSYLEELHACPDCGADLHLGRFEALEDELVVRRVECIDACGFVAVEEWLHEVTRRE